jgi:methionyl-tRNA synthetase
VLRELPFGSDGDFSRRAIVSRINGDLANGLGNLAQRVLSMINRNCDGIVPKPGAFSPADEALLKAVRELLPRQRSSYTDQAFHRALEGIWDVVAAADRYVDEMAPWSLRKTDVARMGTVLYVLAEVIRQLAILMQPVVPSAASTLLDQLAVPPTARDFPALAKPVEPGVKLPKPEGVFPRYVEPEKA